MSYIRERSGLTPPGEAAIVSLPMARFHLFWVRTKHHWDDGFVVARTARAAARFVRDENFALDNEWATAERLTALPDHMQSPDAAVASTPDEPRHVDWASPEVLSACGVIVIHTASPRVFLWQQTILTEGLLDYLRRPDVLMDPDGYPPFGSPTTADDGKVTGCA